MGVSTIQINDHYISPLMEGVCWRCRYCGHIYVQYVDFASEWCPASGIADSRGGKEVELSL